MATIPELIAQYQSDEEMQKEVAEILEDGKISLSEFISFARRHGVSISPDDLPKYLEQIKKLGFIKE